MKRFIRLLTAVIVLMALCSCSAIQKDSKEPSVETVTSPPEVEVIVESKSDSKRLLLNATSTVGEALNDDHIICFDPTEFGYDQKKVNITITANSQNIVSVQQKQDEYLNSNKQYKTVESIQYVQKPVQQFEFEPWVDVEETPIMILEIKLEDNSSWFVSIRAKGY